MKDSILLTKSKAFALRVVRLYKYLRERKESVIAKQMLRSGTSIGANIAESRYAQSKTDFASKLQIALKEDNFCDCPQISIATIVQQSQMANFLFNYIGGTCVICEQSSYRQGTYFALYEAVRFCYITARKEN